MPLLSASAIPHRTYVAANYTRLPLQKLRTTLSENFGKVPPYEGVVRQHERPIDSPLSCLYIPTEDTGLAGRGWSRGFSPQASGEKALLKEIRSTLRLKEADEKP
jgi:hypothetical protein